MCRGSFKYFLPLRIFFFNLSMIILLIIAAIYLGIYYRSNNLLLETVKQQADSYFELIVMTRLWNAQHAGVYVEKTGEVRSNPFLRKLGIEPDIRCQGGKVLTRRNPTAMTMELARIADRKHGLRFKITSLHLLNPANSPDTFELKALRSFQAGETEAWEIEREKGQEPLFRFMKPLYIEEPCLLCHGAAGYRIGDIRGGISVTIPFAKHDQELRTNQLLIFALSATTVGLLIGALFFMTRHLAVKLEGAQERLKQISITDDLTGLRNRRYILERLNEEFKRAKRSSRPLSLIMLDLDHFKRINDEYGHPFGDHVLVTVAERIKAHLRDYDLVGRFGGEEFLVISPEVTVQQSVELAERIRNMVKGKPIALNGIEVTMTISAGLASLSSQDADADALIARSDQALYRAKEQGRDRVVSL
ncbi:MAG TPA: diguanylate cyclase [Nitrospiraceae bacterium]|jgi:diguanylate cyclase (GGDEF)-like protein|nr:MAG: hypothetical protein A2072_00445 [Nitrospirae bacterium GWC1_57_7]HAR45181.1 diguanylate cyclase [Nitrospiraceae bacterium]HAS53435.1 diguanylate cyclase [Nitrospiraceae bacterium]